MSTLGWVALVLVVLAVALVLRLMAGRARGTAADSPRTVADLVRLRAERAEAVGLEPVPAQPVPAQTAAPEPAAPQPAPSQAVVVPEPRAVVEQARAQAEPVDEAPVAAEVRHAAPVRVPASADDTPWNRAARIAENAGIVWATDHSRPSRVENAVPPEPVLRPVRLPAFPPDLVATRSAPQPAAPDPQVGSTAAEGTAGSEPAGAVADRPAVEPVPPTPAGVESAGVESAESAADESDVDKSGVDEPGVDGLAVVGISAGGSGVDESDVDESAAAEPEPTVAADAGSAAAEPIVAERAVAEPATGETASVGPRVAENAVVDSVVSGSAGAVDTRTVEGALPTAELARPRRSPAETAAEQAAADLALLRTFGCTDPADLDDEPSTVLLEGACCAAAAPEAVPGAAQTVAFHVVGRDGAGVPGAGVTLLDDRGGEAAGAVADAGGRGTVLAPHPGSYVLVSAAGGHQPGAVAITVAGERVSADLLLARSASLSGTVHGEDGPVVGARLTLVQDGEIVDTAESGPGGAYRIQDLAAGEYGLSVTAAECEPAAVLVTVPDETDLHHDVELPTADQHHGSVPGWAAGGGALGIPPALNRPAGDVMIGLS